MVTCVFVLLATAYVNTTDRSLYLCALLFTIFGYSKVKAVLVGKRKQLPLVFNIIFTTLVGGIIISAICYLKGKLIISAIGLAVMLVFYLVMLISILLRYVHEK